MGEFMHPMINHGRLLLPASSMITNSTIKIKKNTLAIDAAPAANPKNPNAPAINAITKKIIAQRNIRFILNWMMQLVFQPGSVDY